MVERRSGALLGAGERVAGFEVEAFVARGGMAVVYRARDVALGRTVALKVIAPELAQHDKFRQRFMRESELAASLDHPNIIPIYAAGQADDLLYLVMRFVPGDDLGSVLKEHGALGPREAMPLFTQVAGALDAAHSRQLVHRDVKPGNVLLVGEGDLAQRHVYLSDFGLTKRLSSFTGVTTAGHFLGTIQYVAPEQVANRPVDHRSDIYSLGCVVYEAFAGEPPFVREDDAALLWSHMTQDPPPISEHRSDLPAAVDSVLRRAMAKAPGDRQQNCRELMSDLRSAFRSSGAGGARSGVAPPGHSDAQAAQPSPAALSASDQQRSANPRPARTRPEHSAQPTRPAATRERPTCGRSAAGAPRQPGPSAGGKPPRSQGVRWTAIILALVLLVSAGTYLLFGRDRWVHYAGADSEAAVALDHPKSWTTWEHLGSFNVFSPTEVTNVFTPDGDWTSARDTARSSPEDLVGAYVSSTGSLQVSNFTPLADQLDDLFVGISFVTKDEASLPAGVQSSARALTGIMRPRSGDPALELFYELVVLPPASGKDSADEVLLFCRQEDRQRYAKAFARVVASLQAV